MHTDLFGHDVSLKPAGAVANWNALQIAFLSHGAATPDCLAKVLAADPGFALGHAVKGLLFLMLGRRELVPVAQTALTDAEAAAAGGPITPREEAYIRALSQWLSGSPSAAIDSMESVLAAHPRDALAMKMSHSIRFILGDILGMRRSVENVLPAFGADHPARGYVLGCHAFTLEETGEYAQAEAAGRAALDVAGDDAWGLHAVAHVYDMTGNPEGGLNWLDGRDAAWQHCSNFSYHVWWHRALMHVELGQNELALDLYDREIRADRTDDYRDISNGTSLLSRLELNGVDVGSRWEELADLCEARTGDGCLVFADLHYLLALIGDGRTAAVKKLIGRIVKDGAQTGSEALRRMKYPGMSAAIGLEAFGEGNYAAAFVNLQDARPAMQTIGGSHAQRDVFERLTIDAGIRAGLLDRAEALLRDRKSQRGGHEDRFASARFAMISGAREAGLAAE